MTTTAFASTPTLQLNAEADSSGNYISLNWTNDDTSVAYQYIVVKSDDSGTTYETIPLKSTAKVLNVYPGGGTTLTDSDGNILTDMDGNSLDTSANVKLWMENEGYGKSLITVDNVSIANFNSNPSKYLYKTDGEYNYDVVYIGAWDDNNGKDISSAALTALQSFISAGGGYLGGHDTADGGDVSSNLITLTESNINILCEVTSVIPMYGKASGTIGVSVIKKGFLVNYPWTLSGLTLSVPASHSTGQFAMGNVWMKYTEDSLGSEITSYKGNTGTNNFYLTTWNNTALIQTGHSNGSATTDEKKVLANTLLYLSQISSGTSFDDHTGQDVTAPDSVSESGVSISVSKDKSATVKFSASTDNGNTYLYKLKAIPLSGGDATWSQSVSEEIVSGIQGYAVVIDQNSSTTPSDTVTTSTLSYSKDGLTNGTWYAHIKAIDDAGNASGTIHISFTVSGASTASDNTLSVDSSTVTAGGTITLTATGDRQSVTTAETGDERYIPVSWKSTESGKSGTFTLSSGTYTSDYITATAGSYTVTATFQKQTYNGSTWSDSGSTDTKTVDVIVNLEPVTASATNNSVSAVPSPSTVTIGDTITITATGDRQNESGVVSGDERYIPVSWISTEAGISGSFTKKGGAYTSSYTTVAKGSYTVTVTFQKQIFDGTFWNDVSGSTDTKTVGVTVNPEPVTATAANNGVSAIPNTVSVGDIILLSATGDRQNEAGVVSGDERYIPVSWESTENGKSGTFKLSSGIYTAEYTTKSAGNYIVTATFQKQIYDGKTWNDVSGSTDAKAVSITVSKEESNESVYYTVLFKDWNGTLLSKQYIKHGEAAKVTSSPTRMGYTFIGWSVSYDHITCDTTVTAQYRINSYKITFIDWDGDILKAQIVKYGSNAEAPEAPSRSGYTFTGWSVSFEDISEDTTVAAKYKAISYTVKFDTGSGSTAESQTVEYNGYAEQPDDPKMDGYVFAGWYTDSSRTKVFDFKSEITADITLYAKWINNAEALRQVIQGLTMETVFDFADGDTWECVTSDFVMLSSGSYNTKITWTSSNLDVVQIEQGGSKTIGKVTCPKENDASVVITATIVLDDVTISKTFLLIIQYKGAAKMETRFATERTASVQMGNGVEGETIYRTILDDGTNIDYVTVTTQTLQKLIEQSYESDNILVTIGDVSDATEDEFAFEVPYDTVSLLVQNGFGLTLKSPAGEISLTSDTLSQAAQNGLALYFRIVPVESEADGAEEAFLNDGTIISLTNADTKEIFGTPTIVETNMEGYKTTILLPFEGISEEQLSDEDFLDTLCIYAEHDDGTTELIDGTVVYRDEVPYGISFETSNFSRFQIVSINERKIPPLFPICICVMFLIFILIIVLAPQKREHVKISDNLLRWKK